MHQFKYSKSIAVPNEYLQNTSTNHFSHPVLLSLSHTQTLSQMVYEIMSNFDSRLLMLSFVTENVLG